MYNASVDRKKNNCMKFILSQLDLILKTQFYFLLIRSIFIFVSSSWIFFSAGFFFSSCLGNTAEGASISCTLSKKKKNCKQEKVTSHELYELYESYIYCPRKIFKVKILCHYTIVLYSHWYTTIYILPV